MYSLTELLTMLSSDNPTTRYDACEWLRFSQESSPEVIRALQNATQDSDAGVASRAAHALESQVHRKMMASMGIGTPEGGDQPVSPAPSIPVQAQPRQAAELGKLSGPPGTQLPDIRPQANTKMWVRTVLIIAAIIIGVVSRLSDNKNQDAMDYNEKGLKALDAGDLAQAMTNFNQAIEIKPEESVLYYNRASVYFLQGDFDLAVNDFTKAIQLGDHSAIVYNDRGAAYLYKGELETAIADLDQAIQIDPKYPDSYYYRGLAYANMDELDKAIDNFDQTILLDPNYADAYIDRATSYYQKGNRSKAINDYTTAIKLNPNDAFAYQSRGYVYGEQGDLARAINDFSQAIAIDPNDGYTYYYRGQVYASNGDNSLAASDYQKSLDLCGDDTELCQHAQEVLDGLEIKE